jgi:hypothetical protein
LHLMKCFYNKLIMKKINDYYVTNGNLFWDIRVVSCSIKILIMKRTNFTVYHVNYFFEFDWKLINTRCSACEHSRVEKIVASIFDAYGYDQDVRIVKEGLVVERKGPAMNDIYEPVLIGASCIEILNELRYDVWLTLYSERKVRLVKRVPPCVKIRETDKPFNFTVCTSHPAYTKLHDTPYESGLYLMGDIEIDECIDNYRIHKYYTQIESDGFGMVNWKELLGWADKYGLRKEIGGKSIG